MDLGFIRAGFRVVWANDFDYDSCETYRQNIDSHIVYSDIDGIPLEKIPNADLVIGGPPCQGFSVAGKMDPNDPRSKMVWHFIRIIEKKRPKYFVMENVKALGAHRRWSLTLSTILAEFSRIGYRVQYSILNAADYGVPQFRERVFFVGTCLPDGSLGFPAPTHTNNWVSAREVLSDLPPAGKPGNEGMCTAQIAFASQPVLRRSPYAGMLFNGQGRPINLDRPAPTMHASMGGNKTPILDLRQLRGSEEEPWIVGYHRRIMNGEMPGQQEVPDYMRRFTVKEAARVQSFSDDFRFCGKQSSQFRQIGNAVPPRLAYCIGQTILGFMMGVDSHVVQGNQEFQAAFSSSGV